MYEQPESWHLLMEKLSDMCITYTHAQIDAGCKMIQVFDSWVGALNREDYRTFIAPHMQRIFRGIKEKNVPVTTFGVGASHLIEEWNALPVDVVGLDWRIQIEEARAKGITKTLQGNLDPAILLAPWAVIEERLTRILDQGLRSDSYIFNLGHGVFPEVQPDTLRRVSEFVHTYSADYKSN